MKINETTLNDSDIMDIDAKLFNSNYRDSADYKRTPVEVEFITDDLENSPVLHRENGIK